MTFGPLSGYTVGVTADRRSDEQCELLARRGATVIHGPAIHTLALHEEPELRRATEAVIERRPDAVLLVTGLGAAGWFAVADSLALGIDLRRTLAPARIYARGPKAAGAATAAGLDAHWVAPNAFTSELIDRLVADRDAGVVGRNLVALQLDGTPDTWIERRLSDEGFEVIPVPIYRWTMPENEHPALQLIRAIATRTVDAVTFTSSPTIRNFVALARSIDQLEAVLDACNSGAVSVICVGPISAETARAHGIVHPIEPAHPRLGAMVQACAAYLSGRSRTLGLAGFPVTMQGRLVRVEGRDPITLSNRERDLLDLLVTKPGAVFSKDELLRSVWRGVESDAHVVEVTIGRLRRQLGTVGNAIETVVRRGYRLVPDPTHDDR